MLDGTTQIGSATVGANGAWSANVTLPNQGANVIMATDANATGTGTSSAVTYTLDPPATGSSSSGTTASGGTSSGTSSSGTTGSTTSTGTTSSSGTSGSGATDPVAPALTVADNSLSVSPGGQLSLGIGVSVPNAGDDVSVKISGLPKYETITDTLDGKTFSGSSVTLTAAEVNSGLTLNNSYHGHGHPTATLTVTATDATGTPVTSTAQTITVKDPPATASSGSSTTSGGSTSSGGSHHHGWFDHHHGVTTAGSGTTTSGSSGTSTTTSSTSSGQSQTSPGNIAQWFNDHPGFAQLATTLSEAGASKSGIVSTPTTTTTTTDPAAGVGAKAYALLNQMMAGDLGAGWSHFASVLTAQSSSSQQQASFLTRPLH